MAVRPILRFPDPRLRQVSQPVTAFDATLRELVSDMKDTMYLAEGAGLAAIQIGEPLRLFIIDPEVAGHDADDPPLVLANPELVSISKEEQAGRRGLLVLSRHFRSRHARPAGPGARAGCGRQDLRDRGRGALRASPCSTRTIT
jgi:peptide deformylase